MSNKHNAKAPKTTYLAKYQCTPFLLDSLDLSFVLDPDNTKVYSRMSFRRRPGAQYKGKALELDGGENLQLESLKINGRELKADKYQVDKESLKISKLPSQFTLEITTRIAPSSNTSLNGLYVSSNNFCTQCEAEGFRNITYMYDRPDVMARYTTTIIADREKYPRLLSNGNLIESGIGLPGEKNPSTTMHWVKWADPFPKPTYLFALVAGDLSFVKDTFTTRSGKKIALQIYVQHHNVEKCDHAMASLKKAMKWDEDVYGREYDLDTYMIVAVDDFNMGAMENKGLNVFNSKYVLAKPETATDGDYHGIEGVIGHEYFHNWSGNRVTCRDWFQLSLKEGFTVFRDQEFSSDMTSKGVNRIHQVNVLRTHQFKEDAGPMAHPVRPDSYVEINNFYTVTVYNKGAEVVRMLHSLLGAEKFRRGTDNYFSRHDGQAVTTDDFVKALEDTNNVDFTQFRRWYSQAGTPEIQIKRRFNKKQNTFTLDIRQSCPKTPGQASKKPFHIPLAIGLLDEQGRNVLLKFKGDHAIPTETAILELKNSKERFTFTNLKSAPIPSVLRGFSAPVKVKIDLNNEELAFLMAHDSDDFNRWDAGQQLAVNLCLDIIKNTNKRSVPTLDPLYINALKNILADVDLDDAMKAQAMGLPLESYVSDFLDEIDPVAVHDAILLMRKQIASELHRQLLLTYHTNKEVGDYSTDHKSVGRRSLKNKCLSYLVELDNSEVRQLCVSQYHDSKNMTDVMAALVAMVNCEWEEKYEALAGFYTKWKQDPLVVDKWLGIQATSRLPDALEKVKVLASHEAFNIHNPNKIRALIGAFSAGNAVNFHNINGKGYKFLADYVIKIDSLNPQISARMVNTFCLWRKYDKKRQVLMKKQLERILDSSAISKDVYEIVSKSLL